jgi:hypothetical protein
MVKNMKQVNKMLENVNNDMNAAELTEIMEKFEQVSIVLFFSIKKKTTKFFLHLGIRRF